MKHKFLKTTSLDDYLPAMKDKTEFILVQKGWFQVVDYAFSMIDTFQSPNEPGISEEEVRNRILRKDLRGIKFDLDGQLIQKPYHKFHNLNEKEDYQLENIDWSMPHTILEKLDGSMIVPIYHEKNDGFRLTTKMGITDVAMKAEVFLAESNKYWTFLRDMHEAGLTPMFEWFSKENRIVVHYPEPFLILTGVRETISGQYLRYEQIEKLSEKYDLPCVKFSYSGKKTQDFLESVVDMVGIEGFIVRFDDGHMVKVKSLDYMKKHNSKEYVQSERQVVKMVLDNTFDDLYVNLDPEDKLTADKYAANLAHGIRALGAVYEREFSYIKTMDKRDFAVSHSKAYDPLIQKAMFSMFDGRAAIDLAQKTIVKYVNKDRDWTEFNEKYGELLK